MSRLLPPGSPNVLHAGTLSASNPGWAPSQSSGVRVREGPPQLSHTSQDFGICRPSRFLRASFPGPEWIWAHSLEAESWLPKHNLGIAAHSPPLTSPSTLTPLLRLFQSRETKLLLEKGKKNLKTKPRIPEVVLACFRGTSMRGLPHVMRPGSHFPSLSSIPTCTGLFLGSPCPLEAELAAAVPGSEPLTSTLKMSSSHPGKGLSAFHVSITSCAHP